MSKWWLTKDKSLLRGSHGDIGPKPCKTCGKKHSKSAHRSHGNGSFARTHKKRKGRK